MNPVVHDISSQRDFPETVQAMLRPLAEPLPSWLKTGPYPYYSSVAAESLSLLKKALENDSTPVEDASDGLLRSVFDLILSTSTDMRTGVRGNPRMAFPFWVTFTSALLRTISDDIFPRWDASFIKPREEGVDSMPVDKLDGRAILIASHIVAPEPTNQVESGALDTNLDGCERAIQESFEVEDHLPSIDLPLEAHVVSGKGRRFVAELPVFVIADPENIIPLLSSVLYQRRVWGIQEVAIGLVVSDSCTTGRLMIAWLNKSNDSEVDLPPVHVAPCEDQSSVLGVFDLADPRDAFIFARFVLRLSSHYDAITGSISLNRVRERPPFMWSSDYACPAVRSWKHSEDRMADWLHEQSEADFCVPPGENIAVPNRPDEDENSSLSIVSNEDEDEDDISASDNIYPSPSYWRDGLDHLNKEAWISDWLLERRVLILARTLLKLPTEPTFLSYIQNIKEHVDFYNQMTMWSWPTHWTSLEVLPLADSRVEDVRSKLWNAYKELCLSPSLHSFSSPDCPFPAAGRDISPMDHPHLDIIISSFSALLDVSDGASRTDPRAARTSGDAGRRHYWDILLMKFYQTQPTPNYRFGDIFLERLLNFSRNPLVDVTDRWEEAREALIQMLYLYDEIYADAARYFVSRPPVDPVEDLLLGATLDGLNYRRNFQKKSLSQIFVTRPDTEPSEGICDAVLSSRCQGGVASLISALPADGDTLTFLDHFLFLPNAGSMTEHVVGDRAPRLLPHDDVMESYEGHMGGLETPIDLRESLRDDTPDKPASVPEAHDGDRQDLLLPVLVARHENHGRPSMGQCRTYLLSALQFLGSLGFADRPVFGILMHRKLAVVTMGWQTDGKSFILERGVQQYDIADPFQAFQFALFLVRLAAYAKGLEEQNNEVLKEAIKNVSSTFHWSKKAQMAGLHQVVPSNASQCAQC